MTPWNGTEREGVVREPTRCQDLSPPTTIDQLRWGLCCQFLDSPIRFRQATHRHAASLGKPLARAYLSSIVRANAIALAHAVARCAELGIGAFRISSRVLPLATHPVSGYTLDDLDQGDVIRASFRDAGALARFLDVRLSFHPDQFVVLNSERETVVRSSVAELEATAALCELLGADTMTVHVGGATGGRALALARLRRGIELLSPRARARLAVENDDRLFTPADLLPVCRAAGVPLVYDVHHHRCNADRLSLEEATAQAAATWGEREPWTHISSPRDGWHSANPRPHAGFVDPADFPDAWFGRRMTIDVEAKAKERAVQAIRDAVRGASPRLAMRLP